MNTFELKSNQNLETGLEIGQTWVEHTWKHTWKHFIKMNQPQDLSFISPAATQILVY